ncbi:MAG: class A beta-lactamase-related serine hydrolase, partial [Crocinitomicaceae bacterium]|nr:class A beta-lactamase-related serine hydrolase [Crocinitomicaceae bacterium]
TILFGQTVNKQQNEIELKIKQVESNLVGNVQIENIPSPKWTLEERMRFYHANGLSISVIKDYKVEWTKYYGWADSMEQRPVTSTTRFQAASNSKSLHAIGILKLVQEGKIQLDKDINTYLKSWKFPYDSLSKNKKITVANLLSHTAGLSTHGFRGYKKGEPLPSIVQILDGVEPSNSQPVRSEFEPSEHFNYSGGGTIISQLILTDVTGMPYDEYMFKNVLAPLGMNNSSFSLPALNGNESILASGYYDDGYKVEGGYNIHPELAAAGLWTTSTDLAKYVIETQLALEGKSKKVLNQKITKLRLTPYLDKESALGVFILDRGGVKYFNHGGTNEGFVSQYVGSLEGGNGVVVMTNTLNPLFLDEIIYSVAHTYNWKNFTPEIKKVTTIPDSFMNKYVGSY